MLQALLPIIAKIGGNVISKAIPDKDLAIKIEADFKDALLKYDSKELESAASIIVAEANGESWIQRSWRPLVMLVFAAIIVAHFMGYTAPGLSEDQILALFEIIKIGIGGYVVGRSAEKSIKYWKSNA